MCEAAGCQKVDRTSHMLVAGQTLFGRYVGKQSESAPLYEALSV